MKQMLERLMRHSRWANEITLQALYALDPIPHEAARLLAHIVTTERLYLSRMRGDDPFPQDFWPALTLHETARTASESGGALITLVRESSAAELARKVRYRNSAGDYFETPLHLMLTHVALHGEHHRGQIARLVREAGGQPPVTDFIAFVRQEAPSIP